MRSADTLRVCVDFGSTFTKSALVDLSAGALLATAEHPTTVGTDVLDGYDACLAELGRQHPAALEAPVLACSSAGGGLRIAVVGNEELVTAEAGRRVALSSGGTVVAVLAASRALPDAAALADAAADVVLLTGGTDGGNPEPMLRCARALVAADWRGPVVVAGNAAARDEVEGVLRAAGIPAVVTDNVVPRIGELAPEPARAAIREVFLRHVIGGKHLSARPEFAQMVRGATPDVVLTGVELLARGADEDRRGVGDVAVVDLGGATTDVHSVVEVDPDTAHSGQGGLSREVVATTPVSRTVEGDLGMRWSAVTTVAAGVGSGLLAADDDLAGAALQRRGDPGWLPSSEAERARDEQLARAAVAVALRRHAGRARVAVGPDGRVVERSGKDLREVDLVVLSGGVLRHGRPGVAHRVLTDAVGADHPGGWQLPRAPRVLVDDRHLLAWAGLLAAEDPGAAHRLLQDWCGAGVGSLAE